MIFSLLGEEVAEDMKISSVLPQQDMEQLNLLLCPHLRFLLALGLMSARYRVTVTNAHRRFHLILFLN